MSYVYKDLRTEGFLKIPVTRRQHNRMLPNRKQKAGARIEYYWHPEKAIFEAQYFCSAWMKVVLIVFMFIPAILMQGLPETLRDLGDLIHERKRGKFVADRCFLSHEKTTDGVLEQYIRDKTSGVNDEVPR